MNLTAVPTRTATPATPPAAVGTKPTSERVVVVGAGPAGMATAIELAQHGIPSVVLEKRGAVATRENLFNVFPAFADRLAALDPEGSLTKLLQPTEAIHASDEVTGARTTRAFQGPLAPDGSRSRGDMDALLASMGAPVTDARRAAKVGIGDLENALRELATTRYGDLVELRSEAPVAEIRQGDGFAEAVLASAGETGTADAVRGAMLVDASGADLLGGPRRVFPEQTHWVGGRFEAPSDGTSTVQRRRAVTEGDGSDPTVTIRLPANDRTLVWAQVGEDARAMSDADRGALLERRAKEVGVEGGLSEPRRASPVTVQLWTSEEPARGRVLKVGDSVRAPYFPTSSGAAAALVHDAPRAVDAIRSVLAGTPVDEASSAYAEAVRGANEALLDASRRAMLADLGRTLDDAGEATVVTRPPAVAASSPQGA